MRRIILVFGIFLGAVWVRAEEAAESPAAQDLLVVPAPEPRPAEPAAEPPPAAKKDSAEPAPATADQVDPEQGPVAPDNAGEDILPPPFPASRYQELWERSPFQLESAAPPPAESAALAQRFALTGIAEIGGEPIAFLMERATQQRMMVKQQEGEGGLSLVQIDVVQRKYDDSTVTVRQGSEVGVVKFDAGPAMAAPSMPMPPPQPQAYAPPNVPGAPPRGMPAAQVPPLVPGQAPQVVGIQPPGAPLPPGVVPGFPGPGVPQNGQVQQPGQQPMPPPRVIRRRAIVPAAP
ncbi:MAG: hypothetical protein WEC73_05050 [Chthoniobacterales bacterium]